MSLYCIRTAKFVGWLQLQTVDSIEESSSTVQPSVDHEPFDELKISWS